MRNSRFRFFPEWLRTIPTAIRARLVDQSLRPQCATPVSHARFHFRGIPLSYSWAFPDQDFPAFDRYYEDATTSQTSQRRSRLTRPPVPAIDCTVRSSPAAVAQATPRCCSAGSSVPALFSAASFGISRVSVEPVAGTPCSQTPAEPRRLAMAAFRYCPPLPRREGLLQYGHFGIQSHGSPARCQRFVPPSRTTTHDSLTVGGHPFPFRPFRRRGSFSQFRYLSAPPSTTDLSRRD